MGKVGLPFRVLFLCMFFVAGTALASDKYLLNAGDVLNISVWNEEDLQESVVVLPDGTITFPLAGAVVAKGKSVAELQVLLKKNLLDFLSDPLVTVVVTRVSGNTVHILGKVLNPGSFVMSQQLNVMQALSLAGGLSTYAEENSIIVLRQNADTQQVFSVRYADIKSGNNLSSNIKLKSGDTIVIP